MKTRLALIALWALMPSCSQRSMDGDIPMSNQPAYTSDSLNVRVLERNSDSSLVKSDCDDQDLPGSYVRSDCIRYESSISAAAERDIPVEDRMGGR